MLVIFTVEQSTFLIRLVAECITSKQRIILSRIRSMDGQRAVTSAVRSIAEELGCSVSGVWLSMKELKKKGIIDFGSLADKGKPVIFTPIGKWLCNSLRNVHD